MEEDRRSAVAARLVKLASLVPESFGTAAKIRDELKAAPGYLESPVRLAVAGQIKRGKSTESRLRCTPRVAQAVTPSVLTTTSACLARARKRS